MNIYVWKELNDIDCGRYHPEGGVVIIAESLERAMQIAKEHIPKSDIFATKPDYVVNSGKEEKIFTFPDSGCC